MLWLRLAPLSAAGLALTLGLCGCGDPGTGPVDVKWDRTTCERCRMVLSDRHHGAQVRVRGPDGRSRAYTFDDLGCAVIWLDDRPSRNEPEAEIWVNDWRTGDWIDARLASYVPHQITPMEYGFGAQPNPAPGTLTFAEVKARILEAERLYRLHSGHPQPAP